MTRHIKMEIDPCTTVEQDLKLCMEHDLWIEVFDGSGGPPVFKCRLILECEEHNATPSLQIYSDIPITVEKFASDI